MHSVSLGNILSLFNYYLPLTEGGTRGGQGCGQRRGSRVCLDHTLRPQTSSTRVKNKSLEGAHSYLTRAALGPVAAEACEGGKEGGRGGRRGKNVVW